MAKGMKVNRAKTSLQRNLQKLGRVKKQRRKKEKMKFEKDEAVDPLTTENILKKRRTNPKANITLSGKKRKLLIKKLKKEKADANRMEVIQEKEHKLPVKEKAEGISHSMEIDS